MIPIKYSKIKENLYSIEKDGRVYSHTAKKYMKTSFDKDGYITVNLRNNQNGYSHFAIHRLLMIAYKPILNMENMTVDHIDGNKYNNILENLQWVTASENTHLAHITGLNKSHGESHGRAKITEQEARKIIELLELGYSYDEILKEIPNNNLTKKIISKIKYNETWKFLPRHNVQRLSLNGVHKNGKEDENDIV